ncbi:hypothetical protein BGX38DRAFT_1046140, partial [Terfezia claveryi]
TLCLMQESNLLHLIFHRNKNQHRLSKWWKDLSLLRSNVRKLIVELESVGELQAGKPAAPARERVDSRLRIMRRGVIPRAWVAFTGVVATTQFSALGMILLGVLGRIYEII